MKQILFLLSLLIGFQSFSQQKKIVVYELKEEVAPASSRMAIKAVEYAEKIKADAIVVHMNTYGGYVIDADTIRSRLLYASMPVYVFINDNAASAGALISIACDKIYMNSGASIGATTVVDEQGTKAPEKIQSYMRSRMRSTAQSHGYDTIIGQDTGWYKNPDIAEGMVDETIVIPGLSDSTQIVTLTTDEAIKWGYCDAKVSSIDELLKLNGITDYTTEVVKKSTLDKVVSFFANPALRSVFVLLILGGIYFEFQSPGIGFPIGISILAALAYFAPLYIDGMAANWEILVFALGIVLIGLEIFVIPGTGIAGISGLIFLVSGLVLSMIRNVNFDFSGTSTGEVNVAVSTVFFAIVGLLLAIFLIGNRMAKSKRMSSIILKDTIHGKVPIQVEDSEVELLIGKMGTAQTALRPMGRITVDGKSYQAKTMGDFVDAGTDIEVIDSEFYFVLVKKA